jgi:hypothetical protein
MPCKNRRLEYFKEYNDNHKEEHKQYRIENKEQIQKYRVEHKKQKAKYDKKYREDHEEQLKLYLEKRRKIKFICLCGCKLKLVNRSQHLSSQFHNDYMSKHDSIINNVKLLLETVTKFKAL